MAWNTAYSILPGNQASDKKCEETLQWLHMEANQAWKDTNNVVYNHQLRYDSELMAFISTQREPFRRGELKSGPYPQADRWGGFIS